MSTSSWEGQAGPVSRRWIDTIDACDGISSRARRDLLVTEEPLEIRIRSGGTVDTVAVTMRTPGADIQLAAGFLFTEGILDDPSTVARIRRCGGTADAAELAHGAVDVVLRDDVPLDTERARRNFYAASSCGVCGKGSVDAIRDTIRGEVGAGPVLRVDRLFALQAVFEERQRIFARTGGLHGAALFDADGELLAIHEDVGRHNALDKLIGEAWLRGATPLHDRIVLVSGRISFEVVQKCARAGVAFVAGVSAPSSLAVHLAERFGITLVGFLRPERFNLYCGRRRIAGLPAPARRRD
jgi:FdhD protein